MRVTEKRWGRSLRRVAKFRKCFGGTRKKLVVQRSNWDVNTAYTVPMAGPHQAERKAGRRRLGLPGTNDGRTRGLGS